jgi:formate dehydrogenase iron-sulfur subunit
MFTTTHTATPSTRALLVDVKRCIGCRACVSACKAAHGLPAGSDADTELSAGALTALADVSDELHVRKLCMHCLDPSCASVCPVGALRRTPSGPVTYDAKKCLGCRYCMVACPFGVPRYEWNAVVPAVRKCDLCPERAAAGQPTACSEACPAEATVTGTREELLAEARRRLAEDPQGYHQKIYGEHEVGGTSVLFLVPPGVAAPGFSASLSGEPLPTLTFKVLEKVPLVAIGGTVGLAAFAWVVRRRNEALARKACAPGAPPSPDASLREQE